MLSNEGLLIWEIILIVFYIKSINSDNMLLLLIVVISLKSSKMRLKFVVIIDLIDTKSYVISISIYNKSSN